jgi:hypothetical protein
MVRKEGRTVAHGFAIHYNHSYHLSDTSSTFEKFDLRQFFCKFAEFIIFVPKLFLFEFFDQSDHSFGVCEPS